MKTFNAQVVSPAKNAGQKFTMIVNNKNQIINLEKSQPGELFFKRKGKFAYKLI